MNEGIKLKLTPRDVTEILMDKVGDIIIKSLNKNKNSIEDSLNNFFSKDYFHNKESDFENSLSWAIDNSFRIGLEKAMKEINFEELIYNKCKELLNDQEWLQKIATEKVRSSLGLKQIEV